MREPIMPAFDHDSGIATFPLDWASWSLHDNFWPVPGLRQKYYYPQCTILEWAWKSHPHWSQDPKDQHRLCASVRRILSPVRLFFCGHLNHVDFPYQTLDSAVMMLQVHTQVEKCWRLKKTMSHLDRQTFTETCERFNLDPDALTPLDDPMRQNQTLIVAPSAKKTECGCFETLCVIM